MNTQELNQNVQELDAPKIQSNPSPTLTSADQPLVKLGYGLFSPAIKNKNFLRLFNGVVLDLLEQQVWTISRSSDEKKKKWAKIFSIMKECLVQTFAYAPCGNPKILVEIAPIHFPNVKEINLFCADIENFQSLAFISAPHLQKLNLIYNNCVNFKAFDKMYFPSLKILCIYLKASWTFLLQQGRVYKTFSIQQFSRWGFELNELRLEKKDYDPVFMYDLSTLAKSKKSLQNVYISRKNRIKQNKVMNCLRRKQNMKFYVVPKGVMDFIQLQTPYV